VLAGNINYLLAGTQLGGARADVSIRIISTKTGNTIWYIEHTMDQLMDYPDVSLKKRLASIFSAQPVRPSEGAPMIPNMLMHIALDVAEITSGARTVKAM